MIPIKDINPTSRFAVVTIALIVLNVSVYFFQILLGPKAEGQFIAAFAFVPERLFSTASSHAGSVPVTATLFSSMFMHGGLLHLGGNMLYLWIFGNNIEDAMTRTRFIVFYLLCGVIATVSHALLNPSSPVPLIGASGAVSGILGAYLLLYPRAKVLTLIFFGFFVRMVPINAMFVLIFWFVLQFLSALTSAGGGGGVAWFAHIGGFLAGMALIGVFKRRSVPLWRGRRSYYQ